MLALALCYMILSGIVVFMTIFFVDMETRWFDNGSSARNWATFIACVLLIIIIPSGYLSILPDTVAYDQYQIVSINDNLGIRGTFFLGSGTVDSVSRYYFYKKVGDGYMQGSIPAGHTMIFTDENDNPYVKAKYVNGYAESYEIHVPNSTIIREYNLDGK
jgi:hypothetical protein